jgi:hypothetical protein
MYILVSACGATVCVLALNETNDADAQIVGFRSSRTG